MKGIAALPVIIVVVVILGLLFVADPYLRNNSTVTQPSQQTQHQEESDQKQPDLGAGVSKPFYSKDGLYLTHTWPGANKYFSNEETEILLFNESNSSVEVKSFNLEYLVEGKTYAHKSGTWEKYARKDTPQNIEYLNISPQYYKGEPLILTPGQKGKLHWHVNFGPNPLDGKQTVKVKLTLVKDNQTININEQFNRNSGIVVTKEEH